MKENLYLTGNRLNEMRCEADNHNLYASHMCKKILRLCVHIDLDQIMKMVIYYFHDWFHSSFDLTAFLLFNIDHYIRAIPGIPPFIPAFIMVIILEINNTLIFTSLSLITSLFHLSPLISFFFWFESLSSFQYWSLHQSYTRDSPPFIMVIILEINNTLIFFLNLLHRIIISTELSAEYHSAALILLYRLVIIEFFPLPSVTLCY